VDRADEDGVVKTLLLTGFEPFGRYRVNTSWEAIRHLDGARAGAWVVRVRRLPVSYRRAGPALERAIQETRPRRMIALGLRGDRWITLERIALNVDHASIADNDGAKPFDRRIAAGPMVQESSLPLGRMLAALRRAGLPARLSFHAGTYLCNHVFYLLRRRGMDGGFVHVPPPGKMSVPRLRKAAAILVRAATGAIIR
jgi:pyroglutamyl-peptidase